MNEMQVKKWSFAFTNVDGELVSRSSRFLLDAAVLTSTGAAFSIIQRHSAAFVGLPLSSASVPSLLYARKNCDIIDDDTVSPMDSALLHRGCSPDLQSSHSTRFIHSL